MEVQKIDTGSNDMKIQDYSTLWYQYYETSFFIYICLYLWSKYTVSSKLFPQILHWIKLTVFTVFLLIQKFENRKMGFIANWLLVILEYLVRRTNWYWTHDVKVIIVFTQLSKLKGTNPMVIMQGLAKALLHCPILQKVDFSFFVHTKPFELLLSEP